MSTQEAKIPKVICVFLQYAECVNRTGQSGLRWEEDINVHYNNIFIF